SLQEVLSNYEKDFKSPAILFFFYLNVHIDALREKSRKKELISVELYTCHYVDDCTHYYPANRWCSCEADAFHSRKLGYISNWCVMFFLFKYFWMGNWTTYTDQCIYCGHFRIFRFVWGCIACSHPFVHTFVKPL